MRNSQIKKCILEHLQKSDYTPLDKKDLMEALGINPEDKKKFQRNLTELENKQKIKIQNHCIHIVHQTKLVINGTFSAHPRGFGFVQPVEGSKIMENVFIPKEYTKRAVNGDTVKVELSGIKSPKGYDGKVIQILERNAKFVVGTVINISKTGVSVFCPLLGEDKNVVMENPSVKIEKGDRLLMSVQSWGSRDGSIKTQLKKRLGSINDPSIDVDIAIIEHGIIDKFHLASKKQEEKFGTKVTLQDQKGRIDLRELECVTIDPDTAKDFDDALSLEIDKKGHFHLGVHIADVSHYVTPECPIDLDAQIRGNSTYFPGRCVPMLPEKLSNGICSLKPNVIRLTVSALMELDKEGNLIDYKILRTFIKSRKRFTYKEALKILENKDKSPFYPLLKNLEKLALLFKQKRRERGSIDFALAEGYIHLDKHGKPISIETIEYDITHQMVEEFMLKANELVAKHLHHQEGTGLFRVHPEPDIENFSNFFDLASMLGYRVPKNASTKDIQNIFDQARNSPEISLLSVQFIRSLKLAIYSKDNIGHFGLALEHYCHFTSPIRRYSDLIIHRMLFGENTDIALEKAGLLYSESERKSMRAESSVIFLKKLRYLEAEHNKNPDKIYSATITRVFPMRIIFDIEDYFIEGSCHVSQLHSDYYEFENGSLIGSRTKKILGFGKKIRVKLEKVDLIFQKTSWTLA